ncbi:MAG TPA: hypothetical protein DCE42_18720 [Myxococcales bacterium]|nr:hypothetical protein [Deltaproteobacteria bacterium]MBU53289.1 hypothetical protein [Deltaproteobacteria bacterium]HAA56807.1 hypothetical protein [Myxococcales bacterium]|tara:strand:+ start:4912 stop:5589 length:678 start_codon:yes stop_codon:yes gene_type:complete
MSTSQSNKWMLLAPLGVIVALIAIAWGVSKFLGGVLPEEKQTTYTQPSSPAPRLVRFPATPNNTTPRPVARKTAKKGTKPKEREWVGKPSKLPPHAELMARANKKYRVNPNAPKLPKPGSKHYVLKRANFKRWADLPLKEQGARYAPNVNFGRPKGMRITELEENSFIRRLGLYKDDVIMSINGRGVIAPGQAKEYYKRAATRSRNLTISFRRGRKVHTIDFSLR